MTSLDHLLRQAADAPHAPAGFTDNVMQHIALWEERRSLRSLLLASIVTGTGFLTFCVAFSSVLIEYIEGDLGEVLAGMFANPGLFSQSVGWQALVETTPLPSVLLSLCAGVVTIVAARTFLRLLPPLPFFSSSHVVSAA